MKPDIHPAYQIVKFTCSCGNVLEIGSASQKDKAHVDVCSKCHPFYTGKQKLVDTGGRLQKFRDKYKKTSSVNENTSNANDAV